MMQRHTFRINNNPGGTAAFSDTGSGITGAILQMRWSPLQADTGCDLKLELLVNEADTGAAIIVYNDDDCMSASFTRAVRQPTQALDGRDTGTDTYEPYFGNGERMRATVTPGDTGHIEGNLYVWTAD